jgi:hypothetical protein
MLGIKANALVIMATHKEAEVILKEAGIKEINAPDTIWNEKYTVYDLEQHSIRVLITGVGKELVNLSLLRYAEEYKAFPAMVWNLGIAAALTSSVELEQSFMVTSVGQCLYRKEFGEIQQMGESIDLASPGLHSRLEGLSPSLKGEMKLLTALEPVVNFSGNLHSTLLDMESYHIAHAFKTIHDGRHAQLLHNMTILKVNSDYASNGASQRIRDRMPFLAKKLAEVFTNIVVRFQSS